MPELDKFPASCTSHAVAPIQTPIVPSLNYLSSMFTSKHVLIFALLFLCAEELLATHIVGGGITYECLGTVGGSKRYRFTMKVYRDCLNGQAQFDDPASIAIYRGSYQFNSLYATLSADLGTVQLVSVNQPDCIDNLPTICLEEATYTWERNLPLSGSSYFIEYQRCCRTNAITNILNPGQTGATYYVEITPTAQQLCNNSPVFNNFPPVVICNNYPLEVDYSVTDKDGDQLVYSFCAPFAGGGQSGFGCTSPMPNPPCAPPFDVIAFASPTYTAAQPMGGSPIVDINAQTGVISGTPIKNGQFVVGVCVQEFRNGQLLSTTRRDFQFNVAPCAPQVTARVQYDELAGPQQYVIKRCGTSKTVTIINESLTAANIKNFQWTFDLKGGNILQNNTDFNLTVNFPDFGTYTGILVLNEGLECGDTAFVRVELYPPAALDLGADIIVCKDSTITLDAGIGFKTYQWQDSSKTQTFKATTTGVYYVAATDPCGNVLRDSVLVAPSLVADVKLANDSVCVGKSIVVNVPGFSQYSWVPTAGLSCTNCPTVTVQPTVSTTYTLSAVNQDGCTKLDTFEVAVLPTPMRTRMIQFYPNESVTIGGQTYTQPDTITLSVASGTGGCDSLNTYILQLILTTLDLECPANLTVALPGNATTIPVIYPILTATTDCPGAAPTITLLQGLASGGNFPAGVNNVCYTAENTCGNRDTCCFTVTVTTLDIQCPANLTVALPGNATTIPVTYTLPTATTDCPGPQPTVLLLQGLASSGDFAAGINNVCYSASNPCGNLDSCCFTVTVTTLDIQCPANLTVALPGKAATTAVNYALPTATTDCPGAPSTVTLLQGLPAGGNFPAGINNVCYSASNTCGNLDSCCFTVTVTTLGIECPANLTVAMPNNATTTAVNYDAPTATTDCPGALTTVTLLQGLPSGGNFPAGVNNVCYSASSTCGNLDSCCFTVTVTTLDIQCPANLTVALPNNATTTAVNYALPTATTDCPGAQPTVALLQGPASGGNFPTGVNKVCYTADNSCGNRDTCCFSVTVTTLDIQCPASLTVSLPVAATTIVVNYPAPTTTTNCPGAQPTVNLLQGKPSGGAFALGVNKVCYEASNTCGNRDTCCFNVTVLEPSTPCDIKTIGCMKFELLDIRLDSINQRRYRIRATNFCTSEVDYVAIQLPNGVIAVTPKDFGTYAAPNTGNQYIVRNPNASPFYSIRYRSLGVGLSNGQSDVFEYRLPQQSQPAYIHIGGRLKNGEMYASHLNTFYCPVQPWAGGKDVDPRTEEEGAAFSSLHTPLTVRPNPTDGLLFVDMSPWKGQPTQVQVLNAQGKLVLTRNYSVENEWLELNLSDDLASGLYYLMVQSVGGEKVATRFVLQR